MRKLAFPLGTWQIRRTLEVTPGGSDDGDDDGNKYRNDNMNDADVSDDEYNDDDIDDDDSNMVTVERDWL